MESAKTLPKNKGAGILAYARDTGRFLLALRSPLVFVPNTWCAIGGAVENGEDIEKAALREFQEETRYFGLMDLHKLYDFESGDFKFTTFLGLVDQEFEPELNWENTRFKWVKYNTMLKIKPKHPGFRAVLDNTKETIQQVIEKDANI